MKAFLISDNIDSLVGLKFAGINGVVLHERDEIIHKIEEVKRDKQISMLIFTEKAAKLVEDIISEIKLSGETPLVVEIADRHGSMKSKDYILKYIRDSIGLKI